MAKNRCPSAKKSVNRYLIYVVTLLTKASCLIETFNTATFSAASFSAKDISDNVLCRDDMPKATFGRRVI